MNWEAIGAIGEVAGAFVIVVTLIYLSRQVRNSLKESRLSAVHELSATYTAWIQSIAGSSELSAIWNAGMTEFEALDEGGKVRFILTMGSAMRILDDAYCQYSSGRMNDTDWRIYENIIDMTAGTSGVPAYMERRKDIHSPDFVGLVLNKMASTKPPSGSIYQ